MSYALHWTLEAEITFNKNVEYLAAEWNGEVLNNFLDRVEESLNAITQNPLLYSLHRPAENIRKCVINERIILFFRIVDRTKVDILTFWNTWQDPQGLQF